jgi:hypothetical protein
VQALTPLDGTGPVAHGGAHVENLNWLLNHKSQLNQDTTLCLSKATNNSILNKTSNLMNTDTSGDLIQESLTANNNNLDLNNNIISDEVLSTTQKNLKANINNSQVYENNLITKGSPKTFKGVPLLKKTRLSDFQTPILGVRNCSCPLPSIAKKLLVKKFRLCRISLVSPLWLMSLQRCLLEKNMQGAWERLRQYLKKLC